MVSARLGLTALDYSEPSVFANFWATLFGGEVTHRNFSRLSPSNSWSRGYPYLVLSKFRIVRIIPALGPKRS